MTSRLRLLALLTCMGAFVAHHGAPLLATPSDCDSVCSTSTSCDTSCFASEIDFENGNPTTCLAWGTYDLTQECCGDSFCATGAGESSDNCSMDCGQPISNPPTCGNSVCEQGENCNTCPADCGSCTTVSSCNNDGNCDSGEDETCADCQEIGFCRHTSDCPTVNGNEYTCIDDRCVLNDLPFVTTTCQYSWQCDWGWICVPSVYYDTEGGVCLPPWA